MKEKLIEKYAMELEEDELYEWYGFTTDEVTDTMLRELVDETAWMHITAWNDELIHVTVEFLPY